MKTLKHSELRDLLLAERGASFVTLNTDVEPDFYKSKNGEKKDFNNPFANVRKISRINGTINWIYENSVNNQRVREETPLTDEGSVEYFEAKPRQWGSRIRREDDTITPLVKHIKKNEDFARYYLELKVGKSFEHKYVRPDGTAVSDAEIADWIKPKSVNSRQGVENEIICRDYELCNITQITLRGEVYEVISDNVEQGAEAA